MDMYYAALLIGAFILILGIILNSLKFKFLVYQEGVRLIGISIMIIALLAKGCANQ